MTEDQLQAECYQWFHNTYPHLRKLLFHVPNGKKRSKVTANTLKAIGVVKGVSDFIFLYAEKAYCIELKTETGKQSKEQRDFEAAVKGQGFHYSLCYTFEEFQETIKNIVK